MKSFIYVSAFALVAGCMTWQENPSHTYNVYVDESFSADQTNAIFSALTEWQTKTNGFIKFKGTSDANVPDVIAIYPANTQSDLNKDCSATGEIGCQEDEGQSSNVFLPLWETDLNFFRQIALHEEGHAIGLSHRPYYGIMCASRGCASVNVECVDLQQLCSVWGGCDASTMSGCASEQ